MVLKESYFANVRNLPKDSIKIYVMRARFKSVLSPSWELLNKAKETNMDFDTYKKLFIKEIMSNPKAVKKLKEIKELSKKKDVYLICYEKDASKCHRSILIELINNI